MSRAEAAGGWMDGWWRGWMDLEIEALQTDALTESMKEGKVLTLQVWSKTQVYSDAKQTC